MYGLKKNEALLLSRAIKEVIHELGHNFGLIHCHVSDMCDEIKHVCRRYRPEKSYISARDAEKALTKYKKKSPGWRDSPFYESMFNLS